MGAGAGAGGGGGRPGAGPAPPAGGWADLPQDLEAVARAVPAGDRLWFRLVCRRWAAAGAAVAQAVGEEQLPPGKVTRTSMLDMATSVARVKMVLGVLKGSSILVKSPNIEVTPIVFAEMLCTFAEGSGHLAVLKWARAHVYPWDDFTCWAAAKNVQLKVLQCAPAHGCPLDAWTCSWAARNVNLNILQWVLEDAQHHLGVLLLVFGVLGF